MSRMQSQASRKRMFENSKRKEARVQNEKNKK